MTGRALRRSALVLAAAAGSAACLLAGVRGGSTPVATSPPMANPTSTRGPTGMADLTATTEPTSPANPTPTAEPTSAGTGWWQPGPGTTWQWQLTGEIETSFDVDMYDIDLFDAPQDVIDRLHADGRIVVCYFSAGSYEDWRSDAGDFPAETLGEPLEGWPGERWLDVRAIDLLAPVMLARLDLAVAKGCDGVEPDNVDGYANDTGFTLSPEDQLAYNRWLAAEAHRRGLSVGLKNDLEQVELLVGDFDWVLNESCFVYDECELLLPFVEAGKAVFGVEYEGDPADFCPQANEMNFDWLVKNLELDAWRVACRDEG